MPALVSVMLCLIAGIFLITEEPSAASSMENIVHSVLPLCVRMSAKQTLEQLVSLDQLVPDLFWQKT